MVLTSTHNLCFEQKCEKYQNFYLKIFNFLVVKFSVYLNRRVFVMGMQVKYALDRVCHFIAGNRHVYLLLCYFICVVFSHIFLPYMFHAHITWPRSKEN